MDRLGGTLSATGSLQSSLSAESAEGEHLGGTLSATDSLQGSLSAESAEGERLGGVLSTPDSLQGSLSIKIIESGYPSYSGDTVVVPSTSDQVLATTNKIVHTDILVKEIPTFETSNEFGTSFIIAS